MNRTLLGLWAIIFGSILALVALVVVWTGQRETQARLNLAGLLRAELDVYNRQLHNLFDDYDRQLQRALTGFDPESPGNVLTLERHPLVGLVVVVSDDGLRGRLWHPAPERISPMDRSLIDDAVNWIRDNNFTKRDFNAPAAQQVASPRLSASNQAPAAQPISAKIAQQVSPGPATNSISGSLAAGQPPGNSFDGDGSRWTTWYHGRGLVLGYWSPSAHQTITMLIVPRGRWLADVVGVLPDNTQASPDRLVQLVDVEGATISQWGQIELSSDQVIDAELAVDDPLDGWRLRLTLTPEARSQALGLNSRWLSVLVASGFSLALLLLGVILSINLQRQLRLAQQQVSFVNQVSHELRTPLTNIRMYTDLALQGLEPHRELGLDRELERLAVVQQENTRLGRLIENVLAFARNGKPRPLRPVCVEDVESLIDCVVATFEPQLMENQFVVERGRGVEAAVMLDREAFEQILVNLISNALKYAVAGRFLRIETDYQEPTLTVRVMDHGPGIPGRLRQRVFEPFVRGSNRLEDPAGTGIGLSIARQLARQHGGDCWHEPLDGGSVFVFKIVGLPCRGSAFPTRTSK